MAPIDGTPHVVVFNFKGGRVASSRARVESQDTCGNRLLCALPPPLWGELSPHLELVELRVGAVLAKGGKPPEHVHFPVSALVSLIQVLSDGRSIEAAVVGCDGVVGAAAVMGGGSTPNLAMVQGRGESLRMPAAELQAQIDAHPFIMHLLSRYTLSLITQLAQTAACNRHHSLEKQLCRWMLLCLDRVRGEELNMTQELMANMLGVRREAVSLAAGRLQSDGLIRYSRGRVRLLDRAGLEARACECYETVRRDTERLLPSPMWA